MIKKLIPSLFLALILLHPSWAQRVLTGRVTSDDRPNGLGGVVVQATGTASSVKTDENGNYSLTLPDDGGLVTFRKEGYKTFQIDISFQNTVDISMEKLRASNESVSVGYGTQSRDEMTGSISSIRTDAIGNQPVIDLEQANQGRAAGVFTQNNGGKLGEGTTVRIRGGSSLTGSNSPLYVVDGVPLTSDNQSDINPNNIASMEVLKDASAAAIYGSRASNGVILITTKTGQSGGIQVNADYQFGVSQTPRRLNLMSPQEYNEMMVEYTLRISGFDDAITRAKLTEWAQAGTADFSLGGKTYSIKMPILDSLIYNTDWQNEIFRSGLSHRANISLSGGTDKHRVFSGIAYTQQEGILIGNQYDRFNGDLNLSSKWNTRLTSHAGISFIHSENKRLNEDQDLGSPLQAIALSPADSYDPANAYRMKVRSLDYNPLTEINFSDNLELSNRIIGNLGAKYAVTDQFSLNLDGGIDLMDLEDIRRQGPETLEGNPTGFSRYGTTHVLNYLTNAYLDYTTYIGNDHHLSAVAGSSYQHSLSSYTYRTARVNSIDELQGKSDSDPGLFHPDVPGGGFAFLSYFARISYAYDQKYLLQLSGRVDGSSKVGTSNRYGYFPAVSAGWNLSQESFLSDVAWLSVLKIKASYGQVGNTPDDDFIYRRNFYPVNYGTEQGIRLANLSNNLLNWETTTQLDAGIDFSLFNDRLSGSVGYYKKNTDGLLFPVPVSRTSGFDYVLKNNGSMENSGIEIDLTTVNVQTANLYWSTNFNLATNTNLVSDIGGQTLISGVNAFIENQPTGVFYMPVYLGVDPQTGAAKYDNGIGGYTTDYTIALQTGRKVVGNPNPRLFGGMANSLQYKNLELNFMFQFVEGVDKYNQTGEYLANSGIQLLNQRADQVNRWYVPGDQAEFPVFNPTQENTYPSTRWLEDGSFIRLNNFSLSYRFPTDQLAKRGLSNLSVYVGGQNLVTFTRYTGYDADVNYIDPEGGTIGANISRGIDDFTTPQARVFTTGIKIGF
ncbi:MAG: SusC/RagA family TonB-linked outer membrane protein [Cyclobacteriaceae bacterium]|nr:SusC/RagA family TonB-linked outer membrane protein [Cyclobacteriaceae bacterium]